MSAPLPVTDRAAAMIRGRHCLVLGGGGFIGIHLCNALAHLGAEVTAFGRGRPEHDALDRRVFWRTGDFQDVAALAKAVEGQQSVFHLISASVPESSNREPAADLAANTIGTLHLMDLLRAEQVEKVIFTSSGGTVYGIPTTIPIPEVAPTDPISAYGISKLATEKYLALYNRLYGLDHRVLRISNPYGRHQSVHRRQGVIAALFYRALSGQPLEIWGNGEVTRDFIHVDDVITALIEVHAYAGPHRVFNVGSGQGMTIREIADLVERAVGQGRLERNFLRTRAADVPVNILDTSLIQRETGWAPRVDWDRGLATTLDWVRGEVAQGR